MIKQIEVYNCVVRTVIGSYVGFFLDSVLGELQDGRR